MLSIIKVITVTSIFSTVLSLSAARHLVTTAVTHEHVPSWYYLGPLPSIPCTAAKLNYPIKLQGKTTPPNLTPTLWKSWKSP